MTDNRDKEIVRLAVEWAASWLTPGPATMTPHDFCQRVNALASPPEPKQHPAFITKPRVSREPSGWRVRSYEEFPQGETYREYVVGGYSTEAEAVAAWNAMIDRIAGPDDETVRLVGDLVGMLNHPDADVLHRARRWLAERTGGSDGR